MASGTEISYLTATACVRSIYEQGRKQAMNEQGKPDAPANLNTRLPLFSHLEYEHRRDKSRLQRKYVLRRLLVFQQITFRVESRFELENDRRDGQIK